MHEPRLAVDPAHESVLSWAGGGVIAAAALAALLLIFLLVFRRGRLLEPGSKWLLLIGLGLLPSFVLLGANSVILSQSKTVDSCASCHVMVPFVQDMKDPKSDTLAALHYKNRYIPENQCYTCHSRYGIFGDLEAKKKGVRHLVLYYSGEYAKPIRHRGPYPIDQCLKCHSGAQKFEAAEPHRDKDFWKDLESGAATCFDCHGHAHPDFGERK